MPAMPASGRVVQMPLFNRLPVAGSRLPAEHDVAALSIPARGFTGDFYFVHRYADRLWFALGDVAGKGLPAAVIMAMIQEELEQRIESCAITRCHPSATMQRLHTFLRPLVPRNRFATAVVGHLCDDGTLEIANAGHCPPLIARNGGIERIGSTGPVLGPLPAATWQTFETTLDKGDALLLYSDGVIESHAADGEEFGTERLEGCVNRNEFAGRMVRNILDCVTRYSSGRRDDDLTLVAIRR